MENENVLKFFEDNKPELEYVSKQMFTDYLLYGETKPVADYRKLYEDISKSEWFKQQYSGKSLGDFIDVDL